MTIQLGPVAPDFEKRRVKVIGLSVSTAERHEGWETKTPYLRLVDVPQE